MEWIERLNKAINYIEEHLTRDVDYAEAAKAACCSTYHFQRMFAYMAGIPLSEYIRRRKMSLAAVDLQSGDEKIIDIALKYGYASPTAFNRAFQSVQGISPSAARKEGAALRTYPPISFKITVKGVEEMNYRVVEKEGFRIIGVSQPLHKELEQNFMTVPKMWQQAAADGTIGRLAAMMNGQPMGLLGVSACNDEEEWRYYIAVASSMPAGQGLEEYYVPASTWAVFPGSGTNISLQELEQRVIREWLPTSGYEYADAPDIEVYLNADPANAQYEVWVPVVKKEDNGAGD
ncbi:AraC family transcriptional regulator [Lachnotalea sp. AF33-28]|jgi:AraC family transcriptional regulator|uniref:AraC family transcriptional regulator n=1 Tax=Lachnotalea sp. AF33-28 TaxID=2292046 RepID=UPI000E4BE2AC|nr:AraC family transcriptional regulator [Lachnotalea sp. AF33-28]RHP34907.1 AraC family transcriptional regulator [Lachnotalea sp. AF33-28]